MCLIVRRSTILQLRYYPTRTTNSAFSENTTEKELRVAYNDNQEKLIKDIKDRTTNMEGKISKMFDESKNLEYVKKNNWPIT